MQYDKFIVETIRLLSNMYRLGWDERNGGNFSYILTDEEAKPYLAKTPIKNIPIHFDASALALKCLLVTGTGKYFKNVEYYPEECLGIVKINKDGKSCDLLWGFSDGGTFTSEFPTHVMSHIKRLSINPKHRVVVHTHPTNTIAMSLIHNLNEHKFAKTLWQMCTESIVVFPDGLGVLPWMVCGNELIGIETEKKLIDYRMCIWTAHGIFGTGSTIDEAFGLIETVEKSAELYMKTYQSGIPNRITVPQLIELAKAFKVTPNEDVMNS
jgi:rhamnulose-1-phosphate aldolase